MATIKLKNSVTENAVPTTTHLPAVGELAINAHVDSLGIYMRDSGNNIVKMAGPGSVTTPAASTTAAGIAELATSGETTTGTDTARVVTPAGLKAVTDAERTTSNSSYMGAGGGTLTGVLTMPNGSNSAPAINFGDADSGIFGGTNSVALTAGGTQGLALNASGQVNVPTRLGVNTASPDAAFVVSGASPIIKSIDTDAANDFSTFENSAGSSVYNAVDGNASGAHIFQRNGSESLRITDNGELLVNANSSVDDLNSLFQVFRSATGELATLARGVANANGPNLNFIKTRNTTYGSHTIVQDGDTLGTIVFRADDGTDYATPGASISAVVKGTPGANDMPGALLFHTTADGASSLSERVRINPDGFLCVAATSNTNSSLDAGISIGGSSFSRPGIVLRGSSTNKGDLSFCDNSGAEGDDGVSEGLVRYDHDGDYMCFHTADTEQVRIASSGIVGIGTTSPHSGSKLTVAGAGLAVTGQNSAHAANLIAIGEEGSGKAQFRAYGSDASTNGSFEFNVSRSDGSNPQTVVITGAGRVGIGDRTSSPDELLHVHTGSAAVAVHVEGATNSSLNLRAHSGDSAIGFSDAGASNIGKLNYDHGTDSLAVTVNSSERVRITSAGRVGLDGITAPDAKLAIPAQASGDSGIPRFALESGVDSNDFTISQFEDGTGTFTLIGQNVALTSGGNIGVLDSDHMTAGIMFDGRAHGALTFETGGANASNTAMKIDSSGRVMIGTTTEGDATADNLTVADSGNCGITIRSGDTSEGNIYFSDATSGTGEHTGMIRYEHNNNALVFKTATAERFRIKSDGVVQSANGVQSGGNSTSGFAFDAVDTSCVLGVQGKSAANGGSTGNALFQGWFGASNTFRVNCDGKVDGACFTATEDVGYAFKERNTEGNLNVPWDGWTTIDTDYSWNLPAAGTYRLSANVRVRVWDVNGFIKARFSGGAGNGHAQLLFESGEAEGDYNVSVNVEWIYTATAADDVMCQFRSSIDSTGTSIQNDANGRNFFFWERIG